MENIHPFKHYEIETASRLWSTLLPSMGKIKDLIDRSPRNLFLMNMLGGRILIDLHAFDEVVRNIHPLEYETESLIEILCNYYSEDAFRLAYALTYTGKEKDFDADVEKMLEGRSKNDTKENK